LYVLDIYGAVENAAAVDALIGELDLDAQVRRHGFVPSKVLEAALSNADLAINLRNPTMGEASASQLHLWAHALPTLVSRTGWYASLSADTVFHVNPDREVEDVQAYMAAFAQNRTPFISAGQRGRERVLAMHGTDRYADALLQIAQEASVQHGRRAAIDMAHAAAVRLLNLADADKFASLAPPIAAHISAITAGRIKEAATK
jgi:glycosyltransferase involved in cell wall biosynthesis